MNKINHIVSGYIGILIGLMGPASVSAQVSLPPPAKALSGQTAPEQTQVKAYVLGGLDGALGKHLKQVLQPSPWLGQTDGLVILSGETTVRQLNRTQESQLRAVHDAGQVIVLTNAYQEHVDRLNQILGLKETVKLRPPYDHFDFYAYARPSFGPRGFTMMPVVPASKRSNKITDPDDQKLIRAQELPKWVKNHVLMNSAGAPPNTSATAPDCATAVCDVLADATAFEWSTQFPVTYAWGTCNSKLFGNTDFFENTCANNYQVFGQVWPVYSKSHADAPGTGPTDYFITQISGNLSSEGCWGFYDGGSHDERIAAYWARHYQIQATTADANGNAWSFDDLSIDPAYSPISATASTTVTTGTDWNLGGTGGMGPDGATVGFSAGVTFNNSATTTFDALDTESGIGATSNNAQWDFDSWNFVHSVIEPSDQACGGAGLQKQNLPGEIAGSSFSPVLTYTWQASQNVRNAFGASPNLPVTVDLGVLVGWTYYANADAQCGGDNGNLPLYDLQYGQGPVAQIDNFNGLASLYFDVSCAVVTNYGTVPLGPSSSDSQDNAIGNPGPLYNLAVPTFSVPFAATDAQSQ